MSHGAGPSHLASLARAVRVRRSRRGASADRVGDALLQALCILAALLAIAVVVGIVYEMAHGASLAIGRLGLGFLGHTAWQPNFGKFGAAVPLFGTAVSSAMALLLAVPLGISIALFLSTVAPGRVRSVVGPLVEMLASIPSVILGFWGIIVLGPLLPTHVEPFLHRTLGFLPIFGPAETTGASLFNAGLILAIMVLPIVASISRDLFLTVPQELKDGATALGATRWEVVRGVVLPSAASGVIAASFLGLGRALGEAIAVAQVVGAGKAINASLFTTGNTLGGEITTQFFNATSKLDVSSVFYLAVLLLVIGLIANVSAQVIVRRFDAARGVPL